MINNFTIYGERCSGTTYLEKLIKENFVINYVTNYNWKHFFGNYDFKNDDNENNTLFIGIIRHPIDWIDSFYNNQHHIPNSPKNISNFLLDEFYSIFTDGKPSGKEIMDDRNMITGNRYKNIFELRKIKNEYLINIMPTKVKNYILINYDNLINNSVIILQQIQHKFNLIPKNVSFHNILTYKGDNTNIYVKKHINMTDNIIEIIKNNIDKEQEETLGYIIS